MDRLCLQVNSSPTVCNNIQKKNVILSGEMGWKQSLIFVEKRPQGSFSIIAKLTLIYIKTGPWGPTRYIFGNQVTCWIAYEIMI